MIPTAPFAEIFHPQMGLCALYAGQEEDEDEGVDDERPLLLESRCVGFCTQKYFLNSRKPRSSCFSVLKGYCLHGTQSTLLLR